MRKMLFFVLAAIFLLGCEKEFVDIPPKDSITEDNEPILTFLEEQGLRPSQSDKISDILGNIEEEGYRLLLGRRSDNAWFSKLDPSGNEICCFELPPLKKWKYSHYNMNSVLFKSKDHIFVRGWYSNQNDPSIMGYDYDEIVSIVDFNKGVATDHLDIVSNDTQNNDYRYTLMESNYRTLILRSTSSFKNQHLYVVGSEGKILYHRDYDNKIEGPYLENGVIFIDDEIACPIIEKGINMYSSIAKLPIFNLRTWTLIKKLDSENGLIPKGDRYNEPNISYKTDTVYLEKNNIIYAYGEYKNKKDPISDTNIETLLDKYYYEINIGSYNIEGPFKY
jgi:hypothetical protein